MTTTSNSTAGWEAMGEIIGYIPGRMRIVRLIVNPASGNAVTLVDLNTHINRASDPATNSATTAR